MIQSKRWLAFWPRVFPFVGLGVLLPALSFSQGEPKAAPAKPVRSSRGGSTTAGKVSEELLGVQHKIRELRAKALEDRKSQQERIKELGAEKRSLDRTLTVLGEEIAKRDKDLQEKKIKLEAEEKELAKLKKPAGALLKAMQEYLDRVDELVTSGIPWRIDVRKSTVRQVRDLLKAPDASPSSGLAAVGRVQQEEEALGRLVESGSVEIELGKERVAVQAFHLGLLAVIFANEDGTVLGFAQAGQKLEDGLDAASGNPSAAGGYMVAVDILRRRRTPSLVDLFLPALPVHKGTTEATTEEGGTE